MITRPLQFNEYKKIIELLINGFEYEKNYIDKNSKTIITKKAKFRPNKQIALALQLQASLGLRIGDVLSLRVKNFKNNKLEILEHKTKKLQYREINPKLYNLILSYALENGLAKDDKLFNITVRAVQKQLKIITEYLDLNYISTHSFRKFFATDVYKRSNHNLEVVKELLNHTFLTTTQRYIRTTQEEIDKYSAETDFVISL